MAPFLNVSPSFPWGKGFFTLMYSAWMPRINATRFSSVMGRFVAAGVPVGAKLVAAGVACASAIEEQTRNPIRNSKGLGTMLVLTRIVHLLLLGCKLHRVGSRTGK